MYKPQWVSGDWKAICDRCGFLFKASELKETWDKLRVCEKDFETRHPQDFVKAVEDKQSVPWVRPEQTDTYVSVDYADSTVGVQYNTIPDGTSGNGSIL